MVYGSTDKRSPLPERGTGGTESSDTCAKDRSWQNKNRNHTEAPTIVIDLTDFEEREEFRRLRSDDDAERSGAQSDEVHFSETDINLQSSSQLSNAPPIPTSVVPVVTGGMIVDAESIYSSRGEEMFSGTDWATSGDHSKSLPKEVCLTPQSGAMFSGREKVPEVVSPRPNKIEIDNRQSLELGKESCTSVSTTAGTYNRDSSEQGSPFRRGVSLVEVKRSQSEMLNGDFDKEPTCRGVIDVEAVGRHIPSSKNERASQDAPPDVVELGSVIPRVESHRGRNPRGADGDSTAQISDIGKDSSADPHSYSGDSNKNGASSTIAVSSQAMNEATMGKSEPLPTEVNIERDVMHRPVSTEPSFIVDLTAATREKETAILGNKDAPVEFYDLTGAPSIDSKKDTSDVQEESTNNETASAIIESTASTDTPLLAALNSGTLATIIREKKKEKNTVSAFIDVETTSIQTSDTGGAQQQQEDSDSAQQLPSEVNIVQDKSDSHVDPPTDTKREAQSKEKEETGKDPEHTEANPAKQEESETEEETTNIQSRNGAFQSFSQTMYRKAILHRGSPRWKGDKRKPGLSGSDKEQDETDDDQPLESERSGGNEQSAEESATAEKIGEAKPTEVAVISEDHPLDETDQSLAATQEIFSDQGWNLRNRFINFISSADNKAVPEGQNSEYKPDPEPDYVAVELPMERTSEIKEKLNERMSAVRAKKIERNLEIVPDRKRATIFNNYNFSGYASALFRREEVNSPIEEPKSTVKEVSRAASASEAIDDLDELEALLNKLSDGKVKSTSNTVGGNEMTKAEVPATSQSTSSIPVKTEKLGTRPGTVSQSIAQLLQTDEEEVSPKPSKFNYSQDLGMSDDESQSTGTSAGGDEVQASSSDSDEEVTGAQQKESAVVENLIVEQERRLDGSDGSASIEERQTVSSDVSDEKVSIVYSRTSESELEPEYDVYDACAIPFISNMFDKGCAWIEGEEEAGGRQNPSLLYRLQRKNRSGRKAEPSKSKTDAARSALKRLEHSRLSDTDRKSGKSRKRDHRKRTSKQGLEISVSSNASVGPEEDRTPRIDNRPSAKSDPQDTPLSHEAQAAKPAPASEKEQTRSEDEKTNDPENGDETQDESTEHTDSYKYTSSSEVTDDKPPESWLLFTRKGRSIKKEQSLDTVDRIIDSSKNAPEPIPSFQQRLQTRLDNIRRDSLETDTDATSNRDSTLCPGDTRSTFTSISPQPQTSINDRIVKKVAEGGSPLVSKIDQVGKQVDGTEDDPIICSTDIEEGERNGDLPTLTIDTRHKKSRSVLRNGSSSGSSTKKRSKRGKGKRSTSRDRREVRTALQMLRESERSAQEKGRATSAPPRRAEGDTSTSESLDTWRDAVGRAGKVDRFSRSLQTCPEGIVSSTRELEDGVFSEDRTVSSTRSVLTESEKTANNDEWRRRILELRMNRPLTFGGPETQPKKLRRNTKPRLGRTGRREIVSTQSSTSQEESVRTENSEGASSGAGEIRRYTEKDYSQRSARKNRLANVKTVANLFDCANNSKAGPEFITEDRAQRTSKGNSPMLNKVSSLRKELTKRVRKSPAVDSPEVMQLIDDERDENALEALVGAMPPGRLTDEERAAALELVEKLRRRAATLKRRRQIKQRRLSIGDRENSSDDPLYNEASNAP